MSGRNQEFSLDNKTVNFGLGVNASFRPSENASVDFSAKASVQEVQTPSKHDDKVSNTQSVDADLNIQTGGFSANPYAKAFVTNTEDSVSTEQSAGVEVTQTFKDRSSVSASAEFSNSKTITEDEYSKNTEKSQELTVGLSATKRFEDKSALTVGAEYSVSSSSSSYKDYEDAEASESSSQVEQNVNLDVKYNKDNVTVFGGVGLNPQNPKDYKGKVGFRIKL